MLHTDWRDGPGEKQRAAKARLRGRSALAAGYPAAADRAQQTETNVQIGERSVIPGL
jgi:hypothetical protein